MAASFGLAQTRIKGIKIQNADKSHFRRMEYASMTNPSEIHAIPEYKILANPVQKVRFTAAC